jgi:hypothetical protein
LESGIRLRLSILLHGLLLRFASGNARVRQGLSGWIVGSDLIRDGQKVSIE